MEAHEAIGAVHLYNELVQIKENAVNASDYYSASLIESIIDGTEIEQSEIKERNKALWTYSPNKYAPIYLKIEEAWEKRFIVKFITTEKYVRHYENRSIEADDGGYLDQFDSVRGVLIEHHGYGDTEECYIEDVSKILIVVRDEEEDVLIEVINV